GMALRRIADLLDAAVEQQLQQSAAVVGRAANEEILRRLAPRLLEPFDIGFEAARCGDQRPRLDPLARAAMDDGRRAESAPRDVEIDRRRVIEHLDAEMLGRAIERVQHRAAAAEKEGIGAAEAERAPQRRLKPD